jgi:hypothetical protein
MFSNSGSLSSIPERVDMKKLEQQHPELPEPANAFLSLTQLER